MWDTAFLPSSRFTMGDSPAESSHFFPYSSLSTGGSSHAVHEETASCMFTTFSPPLTHRDRSLPSVEERKPLPIHSGHEDFDIAQGQMPSTDVSAAYYSLLSLINYPHQVEHAPLALQHPSTHRLPVHPSLHTPTYDLSIVSHNGGPALKTTEPPSTDSYQVCSEVSQCCSTLACAHDTDSKGCGTVFEQQYELMAGCEGRGQVFNQDRGFISEVCKDQMLAFTAGALLIELGSASSHY